MLLSVFILVSALCSAIAQLQIAPGCRNLPTQTIDVHTTADVEKLSSLALCPNALLKAAIHGTVALRKPISVATNTTLILAAADATKQSVLDGMGTTNLFEVGGTLNITGLTLQNGFAEAGGVITAAPASRVSLLGCKLLSNKAKYGSAIISLGDAVLAINEVRLHPRCIALAAYTLSCVN
jgi:hypothetical protein